MKTIPPIVAPIVMLTDLEDSSAAALLIAARSGGVVAVGVTVPVCESVGVCEGDREGVTETVGVFEEVAPVDREGVGVGVIETETVGLDEAVEPNESDGVGVFVDVGVGVAVGVTVGAAVKPNDSELSV